MHRRSLLAAAVSVMTALSLVLSGCGTKKEETPPTPSVHYGVADLETLVKAHPKYSEYFKLETEYNQMLHQYQTERTKLIDVSSKQQKINAIKNAVAAFHSLGVRQPKVAILAAVEKVNPKMPETVEAAEIKEMGIEGCIIEGPVSLDLAMDEEAAKIKNYKSPVAGDADLLVVPDIVSGNIAAKTLTVLGGGRTGGVVLGARVPVLIVSRAATADDKYMSIVMGVLTGRRK